MRPKKMSDEDFAAWFWTQVDKTPDTGCWTWTASCVNRYGQVQWKGKTWKAHRLAYLFTHGPPGALCVCHSCDNPPCCNPDHLWLGTYAENSADMVRKGRARSSTPLSSRRRGENHPLRQNPSLVKRGEDAGSAKLDVARVLEIRAKYASGMSIVPLARDYGVSTSNIWNIVTRASWRHV